MKIFKLFWNYKERRLKAFWRLLIQGGLFLVCSNLSIIALGVISFLITSLMDGSKNVGNGVFALLASLESFIPTSQVAFAVFGAVSLLTLLATYWFAARWLDKRRLADYGFHFKRHWFKHFGFGLLLGAGLMALIYLIETFAGWVSVRGFLVSEIPGSFVMDILLSLLFFVCVGVYEEMLFRGYQLRNLAEGLNFPQVSPRVALLAAYILSSIIFGLLHSGNPNASLISTVDLFAAGLFLGLGYILTGEMGISIGLHITWNFFEGNVFGFPVSGTNAGATFLAIHQVGPDIWTGGAFGPEAGLVGILALIVGCLLIAWWVRREKGKLTIEERLANYQSPLQAIGK